MRTRQHRPLSRIRFAHILRQARKLELISDLYPSYSPEGIQYYSVVLDKHVSDSLDDIKEHD